jgi:uncharacterized protein YutE (UPF0331/DUF86 family)
VVDRVLDEKFESLRRCLERVRTKTPPSVDVFVEDLDAQDIVAVNLERAVQMSVDVAMHVLSDRTSAPKTMAEAFRMLASEGVISQASAERMVKAVGFRNLAVHAYKEIDWRVVHAIATQHIDDFREFMREILASPPNA